MHSHDVIVIGSGISGLNFALQCAENGLSVLVITKKRTFESSTNYAQGGIAAVLQKTDNIKRHVEDTMKAGSFHNNRRAVEYMVRHSTGAIMRLIAFGVPFASSRGEMQLTREGGHSERRIAFVGDYTGRAIEKVLVHEAKKNPLITILQNTLVTDLLTENKRCYGVRIITANGHKANKTHQQSRNIYSRFTILATGGLGQLYLRTTNPPISTGDGYAMALRAGCKFQDMEFIQFHPTALAVKSRRQFLLSEALRGEGAILRNTEGKPFMKKYDKRADLAPRDVVARAVFLELHKGSVYLDMTHQDPEKTRARFPTISKTLKNKYDLDIARDLISVSPSAHYCCGGIKTDFRGRTGVENLFAFGEVAYTGVHGANRLASNSLLEALVFSSNIVDEMKKHSAASKKRFTARKIAIITPNEALELRTIRRHIKRIMWEYIGVVRTEAGLKHAIKRLSALTGRIPEK